MTTGALGLLRASLNLLNQPFDEKNLSAGVKTFTWKVDEGLLRLTIHAEHADLRFLSEGTDSDSLIAFPMGYPLSERSLCLRCAVESCVRSFPPYDQKFTSDDERRKDGVSLKTPIN